MIKDCKVILNNEAVTVVRFGDIDIQFPAIHSNEKTVRVLYKSGKYSIVNSDYEETARATTRSSKRKWENKKTTDEKIEIETPVEEAPLVDEY